MIKDNSVAKEIKESWKGLVILQGRFNRDLRSAILTGHVSAKYLPNDLYSLLFVHACSVLNDTLKQLLIDKKVVKPNKIIMLGDAVKKAKTHIPCFNYKMIKELPTKRKIITHEGKSLPRVECSKYIKLIENQLRSWKVI